MRQSNFVITSVQWKPHSLLCTRPLRISALTTPAGKNLQLYSERGLQDPSLPIIRVDDFHFQSQCCTHLVVCYHSSLHYTLVHRFYITFHDLPPTILTLKELRRNLVAPCWWHCLAETCRSHRVNKEAYNLVHLLGRFYIFNLTRFTQFHAKKGSRLRSRDRG
jgi:hypothetical protein